MRKSISKGRKLSTTPELPRSVATIAAKYLEAEIIEGRLKPGEHLVEEAWAEEFGISRGSFREVLRILENAKLVEILPRRGAQVATLNRRDVEEIYFLRKHLLFLGFSQAAEKMTPQELEELKEIYEEMERAAKKSDVVAYTKGTQDFDEAVLRIAGINRLRAVLDFLGKPTLRYRFIGFSLPGRMQRSLKAHRRILGHFKNRDAEKAGREVYAVIEQAGSRIIDYLFGHRPEDAESTGPERPAAGSGKDVEASK